MDLPTAIKQEYDQILRESGPGGLALLPLLGLSLRQWGQITPEWMAHVACVLQLPPERVQSVASALPGINPGPAGRHMLVLCRALSCRLNGYHEVKAYLRQRLQVDPGQTTSDGQVTWLEVDCLSACSMAPAMMLDGQLHQGLTLDRLKQLLDGLL